MSLTHKLAHGFFGMSQPDNFSRIQHRLAQKPFTLWKLLNVARTNEIK